MLPQREVCKKVPLLRANRQRVHQEVFGKYALTNGAVSCGSMKWSN